MDVVARVALFVVGAAVVWGTFFSAVQTFVLPRSARDQLSRVLFLTLRRLFSAALHWSSSYATMDRVMALYAPIGLLLLPVVWLALLLMGYTCIFWALDVRPWSNAFSVSGSSLLTLGFAPVQTIAQKTVSFSEAALGLILIALLIAYLPTIYAAFSRREAGVALLEVRAGSPPSAVELLARYQRLRRLDTLGELWEAWENWFVDVEESHTSLAVLPFFRSPQPERSWVTAAGAVLDAAAITDAALDTPKDPRANLCIRAGYICLGRIARSFRVRFDPAPPADAPISILREEFDAALDTLAAAGVPLKADREQMWRGFAGWRANYDTPLLALAAITLAPEAPWSSDRGPVRRSWN